MQKKLVLFGILMSTLSASWAGELDGTKWFMRDGKFPVGSTDVIRFEKGEFSSDQLAQNGFPPAAYEAHRDNKQVFWTATTENPNGKAMKWSGSLTDNGMKGFYTFTDDEGTVYFTNWTARSLGRVGS